MEINFNFFHLVFNFIEFLLLSFYVKCITENILETLELNNTYNNLQHRINFCNLNFYFIRRTYKIVINYLIWKSRSVGCVKNNKNKLQQKSLYRLSVHFVGLIIINLFYCPISGHGFLSLRNNMYWVLLVAINGTNSCVSIC